MFEPIDKAAAQVISDQCLQAWREMQAMIDVASKAYSDKIKETLQKHVPPGGNLYLHPGRYAGVVDKDGKHVASTNSDSDCYNGNLKEILRNMRDEVRVSWDLTIGDP